MSAVLPWHWMTGPRYALYNDGVLQTVQDNTLDASTEYAGVVFQAPPGGESLSEVGFYSTSPNGTVPTYRVSIQGVGSTGIRDGTVKGGGSPASTTVVPSSSSTFYRTTLDNAYSASGGEWLWAGIDYSSGTIDASNHARLRYKLHFGPSVGGLYSQYKFGSDTKISDMPLIVVGNGTVDLAGFGIANFNSSTYAIDSNGSIHETAMEFSVPDDGVTYSLAGAEWLYDPQASGHTYTQSLYSGGAVTDTTAAATATIDTEYGDEAIAFNRIMFSSSQALTNGATYRIGLDATTGTTATSLYTYTTGDAQSHAFQQMGWGFGLSHRTTGNWTDVSDELPICRLLFSQLAGGGGGGGIVALIGSGGLIV